MPLRITLKPYERLIINGASIRNGKRSTAFIIENHCKFLRESELILEADADTAAKKICVTLQVIYLSDDPSAAICLFYSQAGELMTAAPSTAPYLLAIQSDIKDCNYYSAIKNGRKLIDYEQKIIKNYLDQNNTAVA